MKAVQDVLVVLSALLRRSHSRGRARLALDAPPLPARAARRHAHVASGSGPGCRQHATLEAMRNVGRVRLQQGLGQQPKQGQWPLARISRASTQTHTPRLPGARPAQCESVDSPPPHPRLAWGLSSSAAASSRARSSWQTKAPPTARLRSQGPVTSPGPPPVAAPAPAPASAGRERRVERNQSPPATPSASAQRAQAQRKQYLAWSSDCRSAWGLRNQGRV